LPRPKGVGAGAAGAVGFAAGAGDTAAAGAAGPAAAAPLELPSGPDAGGGAAADIQRGENRIDPTGRAPTGIVTEKATVLEGAMTPFEMPASPDAIACPFVSIAATVIRTFVAGVAPGFRSVPRTTSASPDFSWV
jgi:hypothetical protein